MKGTGDLAFLRARFFGYALNDEKGGLNDGKNFHILWFFVAIKV